MYIFDDARVVNICDFPIEYGRANDITGSGREHCWYV
jgi:hypothetical protein